MSLPKSAEPWFADAMIVMLEEGVGLPAACIALGIPGITDEYAANVMRRRSWRDLWRQKSKDYYEQKAGPVENTKTRLVGEMLSDAQRLRALGKFKEAADVMAQVAKIQGWSGPETSISVFSDTSGLDLERAIADVRAKKSTPINEKVN